MPLSDPAAIGYALALLLFAILAVRLTHRSAPGNLYRSIWIASIATVFWCLALVLAETGRLDSMPLIRSAEWARNFTWLIVMLLSAAIARGGSEMDRRKWVVTRYLGVLLVLILAVAVTVALAGAGTVSPHQALSCVFAAAMLVLCEQALRNAPKALGYRIGYVCVTAGGLYLYDLVYYLPIQGLSGAEAGLDTARGFSAAIFALPILIGLRPPFAATQIDDEGDNRAVFYIFGLSTLAIGILLVALGNYYVGQLQGNWGDLLRVLAVVAIVCFVAILGVSPSLRSRVRVFLTKSFLRYKYDYRMEWLRFIRKLSEAGLGHLPKTSVEAIARIVNSPGGAVWVRVSDGHRYSPIGAWGHPVPLDKRFDADHSLVRFMTDRQWVIDLAEMQRYPTMYDDLDMDPWFKDGDKWWIVVPLLLGTELYGFVALLRGAALPALNFEDHDLLRTVGRHVATHLKQAESDRQLSEAQQFSTYHRLSAFLMHDLNNLAAQQSLVVKNAEKHRHDPRFIDDTIATIANSVDRMHRLLEQLSNVSEYPKGQTTDLVAVLKQVVKRSSLRKPRPLLKTDVPGPNVVADFERLCGVFEHLVRNAQDATEEEGTIVIELHIAEGMATVVVRDSGCGMSEEFINERLFRPFDSTKGSESMGIGAYQAREYVRMIGGSLDVASELGVGTEFSIMLPTTR